MTTRALCAEPGADPGLWFSGPEATGHAKAICARCPAAQDCLALALNWHPVEGVWGGTTIGERARILAERATPTWHLPVAAGSRP